MGKISIKERVSVSETIRVDNESNADKKFSITGSVRLQNGNFQSLDSIRATGNGRTLFEGNLMGDNINGTFYGDAENSNTEIMAEVEAFVADVKAEASSLSIYE